MARVVAECQKCMIQFRNLPVWSRCPGCGGEVVRPGQYEIGDLPLDGEDQERRE